MKVIQDKRPRWRVMGIKSLKGVTFSKREEAEREARIHSIMVKLHKAGVPLGGGVSLYEIACAVEKMEK